MRSFKAGVLDGQPPSHALTHTLRVLGEYKGRLGHVPGPEPWADLPFTPASVLKLHGGSWKDSDTEGSWLACRPISASATPDAMRLLHERFEKADQQCGVDPLLLSAAYILDFLCIHPFAQDSERMAVMLMRWLLSRAGYDVGRRLDLERLIEENRDAYEGALIASSSGWNTSEHVLHPWWDFFSRVLLLSAYERVAGFEMRGRGAKQKAVRAAIAGAPDQFCHGDIARACRGVSRPTIEVVLAEMRAAGMIRRLGGGRGSKWEKV